MIAVAVSLFLSFSAAHRAIETYEHNYWKEGTTKVIDCRRESLARVSCIAETHTMPNGKSLYVRVRDAAERRPTYILVHPGKVATFIQEL